MMSMPINMNVHCGSAPAIRNPNSKTPTMSAPKKAPTIEPRPPKREIPPITTAVIDWIFPTTHFVEQLHQSDANVEITVLCGESRLAYDRVYLSSFFSGASADDLALTTQMTQFQVQEDNS